MMRLLGILFSLHLIIGLISPVALANDVASIMRQVKCLTCNGQSILETDTEFAKNVREEIYKLDFEGKTEEEIIQFLKTNYGEEITFTSENNIKNMFIWLMPFIIMFIASLIIIRKHLGQKQ